MMTIRILLFGHYRDAAPDSGVVTLADLPNGATVAHIADRLARRDRRFADLLAHCRVAVGGEFADAETVVPEGVEVAFLPPTSGG